MLLEAANVYKKAKMSPTGKRKLGRRNAQRQSKEGRQTLSETMVTLVMVQKDTRDMWCGDFIIFLKVPEVRVFFSILAEIGR